MVAFLVNRKSYNYLITCFAAEFIGRFKLFEWALHYDWGAFMHLTWGVMYCYCLLWYYLTTKQVVNEIKLTITATVILILFQLTMTVDCKWSNGSATFLFDNYKYIIVFIHCCIVSSLVRWGNIISFMDEFTSSFRCILRLNGYFMFYRYNNKKIQATIKHKK